MWRRNWQRRKYRGDDPDQQSIEHGEKYRDQSKANRQSFQLGSYVVTSPGRTGEAVHRPFTNKINHQPPPRTAPHNSRIDNRFAHSSCQSELSALTHKNKRFKQNLLRSIDENMRNILQWYPEEHLSDDDMDWQPEPEHVIPQPADSVHYIWDRKPNQIVCSENRKATQGPLLYVRRESGIAGNELDKIFEVPTIVDVMPGILTSPSSPDETS